MSSSVLFLALLAGVVVVSARPQQPFFYNRAVPTLTSRTSQSDDSGQYTMSYSLNDGQVQQEVGFLKPGPEGLVLAKKGLYRYQTPEGKLVSVEYLADEFGFHIINSEGLPTDPAVDAARAQHLGQFSQNRNFQPQNQFGVPFA